MGARVRRSTDYSEHAGTGVTERREGDEGTSLTGNRKLRNLQVT